MFCPRCQIQLSESVTQCPRCGVPCEPILVAEPVDSRLIDEVWVLVIIVLHLGCLGIPLYLVTRYSLTTRWLICLVSILYTLFVIWFVLAVGTYLWRQWQMAALS